MDKAKEKRHKSLIISDRVERTGVRLWKTRLLSRTSSGLKVNKSRLDFRLRSKANNDR